MPIQPVEAAVLIPAHEVAVALASEGVPVRAIARSTKVPSEDIYEILAFAKDSGTLLSLPKDDWPSKQPKTEDRAPAQGGPLTFDDDTLRMACASHFKLTGLQSAVFVALLRRPESSRLHIHNVIEARRAAHDKPTDHKMVDVVVCHMRKKLVPFVIGIKTIWGVGYSMPLGDRGRALQLLADHIIPTEMAA